MERKENEIGTRILGSTVPRSHCLNLHPHLYQAKTSTPLQKSKKITFAIMSAKIAAQIHTLFTQHCKIYSTVGTCNACTGQTLDLPPSRGGGGGGGHYVQPPIF